MSAGTRKCLEITLLAGLFGLAAAPVRGATRWDAVPYVPVNPVVMQGSLVLHDDGGDVRAFSSTAQRFAKIAPTKSPILGSGDHLAVVKIGTTYRAWSARLNATADFVQGIPLSYSAFGDDVALLVFDSGPNGGVAWAYSAVTGQWKSVSGTFNGTVASNAAVSGFVIALRTTAGVHGFSARKGEWVLLPNSQGATAPIANGNVALASGPFIPFGSNVAAAFSGVLGNWALSPPILAGAEIKIDHNVALCRTVSGVNGWIAAGYSAYNGRFVTSTVKHTIGFGFVSYLSDNVIAITNATEAMTGIEAFGARPGLAFTFMPSSIGGLFVPIGQDYLICEPLLFVKTVQVFSGVCGGTFKPYSYTNTFAGGFNGVHQFLAVDIANKLIGYSAATHTFTDMPMPTAWDFAMGDAVAEMREFLTSAPGARFHSLATRHGHFTSSPIQEQGATFATASAGSLVARQQQNGMNAGVILVYDERCDRYPAAYKPGGATTMTPGRNVLLVSLDSAPHQVTGYSVARGDWVKSPSAATGSPLVMPQAEENVGYFVDSAGRLTAFGGDGDLHGFYAWPNDTEFQTNGLASGQTVIPPSPLGLALAGEPGDQAYCLYAPGFKCPGLPVGGYQNPLYLEPVSFTILGPLGAIGPSRILAFSSSGGYLPAPACVQLWMQSLLVGGPSGNWLGQRLEGLWFF